MKMVSIVSAAVLAVAMVTATDARAGGQGKGCCMKARGQEKTCPMKSEVRPHGHVQSALTHLETARKAVESGDTEAALSAIETAEKQLQTARDNMRKRHARCEKGKTDEAKSHRPAVVNTTCPIMGSEIDPDAVPKNLYRVHKGQGVGFCCGACPKAWDKLSEEEKDAKLKKAS